MISGTVSVRTTKTMELVDITALLAAQLKDAGFNQGICLLFNPHTTAGLTINEGADPDVRAASLMGSSLTIAVDRGHFSLGTWQKIFFCEFDGPRTRKVHYHFRKSS